MSVRNGTAATPGSIAATRPISVLPHDLRADQGNAEITVWCPKCEERVVALPNGTCGWCDTDLSADLPPAETEPVADSHPNREDTSAEPEPAAAVPPRTPAARAAVAAREDQEITLWRRTEIFEWMLSEGPQTIAHIAARFEISNPTARSDIDQLRAEGRLQRTGVERPGPRGGRTSIEFRAVDPATSHSHAQTGDAEAEQPAAQAEETPSSSEAPRGDAADTDRTIEDGQHDEKGEPAAVGREVAAPITVHEQLVVRYITALIGWIERSSIVRDQGPPEHVYERLERILQIEEGAA